MLALAATAEAQIERQHGAHVHGEATGFMAVDGQRLQVQLSLPGHNLVGFEHPPRNERQQQAFDQAIAVLNSDDWLRFTPAARCVVTSVTATSQGFGVDDHTDSEHTHDHDHHDHDQSDHDHGGHAQVDVSGQVECARPELLTWAELRLFAAFPNNAQLTVDVLTDEAAFQARLTPNIQRIDWP